MTTDGRRLPSRTILDGPDRAAARAYLYGIGYTADDLARPIIGVALGAPVAADIVVRAVAVFFAVRLVVLLLVAHEVVQRVAVVCHDEVHACV